MLPHACMSLYLLVYSMYNLTHGRNWTLGKGNPLTPPYETRSSHTVDFGLCIMYLNLAFIVIILITCASGLTTTNAWVYRHI